VQERFSSLSSAFFRGADAVILIFDVNQPETLCALDRWWSEFCACAPLNDDETDDYCLVVVGNETDLVSSSEGRAVSEEAAFDFIDELVPPSGSPSSGLATPEDGGDLTSRTRHVSDLVPSGPDVEVVIHDNGTLDSDASVP
jgi:Ras-related protein Rab-7A